MKPDDAEHIANKAGSLGLRVALEIERSHELGEEWPILVAMGMADRLRVDVDELRAAVSRLVYWYILRRPAVGGWPRVQLIGYSQEENRALRRS